MQVEFIAYWTERLYAFYPEVNTIKCHWMQKASDDRQPSTVTTQLPPPSADVWKWVLHFTLFLDRL